MYWDVTSPEKCNMTASSGRDLYMYDINKNVFFESCCAFGTGESWGLRRRSGSVQVASVELEEMKVPVGDKTK